MGIMRTILANRSRRFGLLSDITLVGGLAGRLLQRKGSAGGTGVTAAELAIAAVALLRLIQRFRNRTTANATRSSTI